MWSGPRGVKSKVALDGLYPYFENFFCLKLKVNNPPVQDLLVNEVKLIIGEWRDKDISPEIKSQALDILLEISALLRNLKDPRPRAPQWLHNLRDEPIFPVDLTPDVSVLRSASTRFYVPNHEKYEQMCRGHVPILSLDRTRLNLVQPLLDSSVFESRIHYLEDSVESSSIASGPRVTDHAFTEKYASRLKYIER